MRKIIMLALALAVAVILAACGNDDEAADKEKEDTKDTEEAAGQMEEKMKVTDKEKVEEDDVVVKVNDLDVKGKEYNALYPQIKMQVASMGAEVDLEQVKEHTIEALVGQELLRQETDKKGIEVSDKEVNEQVDELKSQDEGQYEAFLEQYGLTEETLKEQLAFELTLDKYAEKEFENLKATDEEVEEMYEQLKAQGEGQDIPELKEVKEQLQGRISQQKKQEKTQAKIEELKENAEVKTMI